MDVLYYWKDLNEDLKADRIGWFRASQEKLAEFQASYPGTIWVFKTPKGMKGKVQLLGRLVWSDTPKATVPRVAGESYMHYDPDHAKSLWFVDGGTDAAIEQASAWMQLHFPAAVRGNFQGGNGQQALRGHILHELEALAKSLQFIPFRGAIQAPV